MAASAALIAPILFVILLIGLPIIGVFSGWKRAAFWGVGNLFVYFVALIFWKTMPGVITNGYSPLINFILAKDRLTPEQISFAKTAMTSILFFMTCLIAGNCILVINYYAWFKKKSGIKQEIKFKKLNKIIKNNKSDLVSIPKMVGSNKKQLTTKYRAINMIGGSVALTGMMIPNLMTTTSTVYYSCSRTATRKTSQFSDGLYSHLQNLTFNNPLSFYSPNEGADLDAGFSALSLLRNKITVDYTEKWGSVKTFNDNVITIMSKIIPDGLQNIFNEIEAICKPSDEEENKYQKLADYFSHLAEPINEIIKISSYDIYAFLSSDNAGDLLLSYVKQQELKDKVKITKDMIEGMIEEKDTLYIIFLFYSILQEYQNHQPQITAENITIEIGSIEFVLKNVVTFKQIAVSEKVRDRMYDILFNFLDSSELDTDQEKEALQKFVNVLADMIFVTK